MVSAEVISPAIKCEIKRTSSKTGFHRLLSTVIRFDNTVNTLDDVCYFSVMEKISSDFYLDQFQLRMEEEFGGPRVYFPEEINLEFPSYLSNNHSVYIFGKMQKKSGVFAPVEYSLPIHFRYQRPQINSNSMLVKVQPPTFLHTCQQLPVDYKIEAPCHDNVSMVNGSCVWNVIECVQKDSYAVLEFEIPTGLLEHNIFVMWTTLFVTIVSVFVLSYYILVTPKTTYTVLKKRR